MDVQIKEMGPKRVAFVHHIGSYDGIGAAFDSLMAWAQKLGLMNAQTEVIGLYYDDPESTPADKCQSDACITVGDSVKGEGEIGVKTIDGGEYAFTTHVGHYDKLMDVWGRFYGEWLPQSGREATSAPAIEIYRNSPEENPPEEWITDLYIQLKKS